MNLTLIKRKNMTHLFSKAITNLVYNNNEVYEAIKRLNNNYEHPLGGNLRQEALRKLAYYAHSVINAEIDRLIDERLGAFFTIVPLEGERPIRYSTMGVENIYRLWAYCIPEHGLIPRRYYSQKEDFLTMRDDHKDRHGTLVDEKGPRYVLPGSYRISQAIDWYVSKPMTHAMMCDLLTQYINGTVNKICSDAEAVMIASVYYKNSVITDPRHNDIYTVISRMSWGFTPFPDSLEPPQHVEGVGNMTDLWVEPFVYYAILKGYSDDYRTVTLTDFSEDNLSCRLTITPRCETLGVPIQRTTCRVYCSENMNPGGNWRHLLTLSSEQGGFGLQMPLGYHNKPTDSLMLGLSRQGTDYRLLYKQPMSFLADDSSYTHRGQSAGFYGWTNVSCASIDNKYVQLGAITKPLMPSITTSDETTEEPVAESVDEVIEESVEPEVIYDEPVSEETEKIQETFATAEHFSQENNYE